MFACILPFINDKCIQCALLCVCLRYLQYLSRRSRLRISYLNIYAFDTHPSLVMAGEKVSSFVSLLRKKKFSSSIRNNKCLFLLTAEEENHSKFNRLLIYTKQGRQKTNFEIFPFVFYNPVIVLLTFIRRLLFIGDCVGFLFIFIWQFVGEQCCQPTRCLSHGIP
jgi:hypothetical protein